jgi:hypothetical protein
LYTLILGAPQLILLIVARLRRYRESAIFGGLLALGVSLFAFEWSILHSNDVVGLGWLFYLASSAPVAIGGVYLGEFVSDLTKRCSQRLKRRRSFHVQRN